MGAVTFHQEYASVKILPVLGHSASISSTVRHQACLCAATQESVMTQQASAPVLPHTLVQIALGCHCAYQMRNVVLANALKGNAHAMMASLVAFVSVGIVESVAAMEGVNAVRGGTVHVIIHTMGHTAS